MIPGYRLWPFPDSQYPPLIGLVACLSAGFSNQSQSRPIVDLCFMFVCVAALSLSPPPPSQYSTPSSEGRARSRLEPPSHSIRTLPVNGRPNPKRAPCPTLPLISITEPEEGCETEDAPGVRQGEQKGRVGGAACQ